LQYIIDVELKNDKFGGSFGSCLFWKFYCTI